ncbi:MAG: hypothetical protein RI565_03280, partial [Schleiferiaceae bacterium]|nr:hypothetical protein [Schleiferiaceae bacterium]
GGSGGGGSGGGSGGGGSGGGGSGGGGSGSSEGDLTIWTESDLGCGFIDVTLNGDTEQMTHYYSGGNPGCGATGCANYYDLPYGTYSYSATSSDGCTWSGSVSIDEDCTTIEFTL